MEIAIENTTFAIIDVETTGGVSNGRMTEVCIILIKNGETTGKYTSLINPQCFIPQQITALTGIDNELVATAPTFAEIAHEIDTFTKDTVFVAHNVNFDFGFFKKEFAALGVSYSRKKLCTVRLSRKLIPGLPSYSLGRLTRAVGIELKGAHRAEADTVATASLFTMLLKKDAVSGYETILKSLHGTSKEGTLPPHLPASCVFALPETPGIYLFRNQAQKIIYAGKAKNIKSRVLSHLYSKVSKEIALAQETYHIDFEETGNELTALLLESHYIHAHYPKFNKAQKRPTTSYQIIKYTNRKGIIQLAIGKTKATTNSIATLYSNALAIEKLMQLCTEFELCPKFCSLQSNVTTCSHYKVQNCKGICSDNEAVVDYNNRVSQAIIAFKNGQESYIIKGKGRTHEENTIVLIENGIYQGFGYIDRSETILTFEDFSNHIKRYKSTFHTTKILQAYHKKQGAKGVIAVKEKKLSVH